MMAHYRHLLLLKHRKDQTHNKTTKKNQEKGGSLPLSSCSALSLLAPTFALSLLHFCFKCFLLASSSFQVEEKKNTKKKKNHRKRNICRERKELTFKLSLCPLTFGSCFYFPTFAFLFQMFSPSIFFFSNRRKKNTKKKKP